MGHWYKFLFLIFAYTVTVYFIDLVYKPIPTYCDNLIANYVKIKESTQAIIIGNSHLGALRSENIGSIKPYNFSMAGLELSEQYIFLKEAIRHKSTALKYVFLGMDYDQIGHLLKNPSITNQLIPYSEDNGTISNTLKNIICPSNFFRHNQDIVIVKKHYTNTLILNDTNILTVDFKKEFDINLCKKRAIELSSLKFFKKNIADNYLILSQIRDLLDKNSIKLILLNTPKSKCFTDEYLKNIEANTIKELKEELAKRNFRYLDLFNDSDFNDKDFVDYDHLNKSGVLKFNAKISKKIN